MQQFGYVVPDLAQAIKGWIDQGVGPWFTVGPVVVTDYKYLERPSRPLLIFGFCQVGGVQLELIQPLDELSRLPCGREERFSALRFFRRTARLPTVRFGPRRPVRRSSR